MAQLVKLGSRIINLDQIKYVRYTEKDGKRQLIVFLEPISTVTIPAGQTAWEVLRKSKSLNMAFYGDYAELLWKMLCAKGRGLADTD